MKRQLEKCVGQAVTVIYKGRHNGFSKRRIKVLAVSGETVKAYCFERKAPRTFAMESLLAVEPTTSRRTAKIS